MPKTWLTAQKSNPDRAIAMFLGLLFLSFYILTAQGSIQSLDGTIMYELTESMVEKGSVAIGNPAGVRGLDGRFYSKYGLGQSLAAVPFYLVGKYVAMIFSLPFAPEYAKKFFVSMLNPVVTAFTCMLLYVFGLKFGYSRKVAVLITFIFGLGTMAWPYAQTFYSDPLTTLLLLGIFYLLMKDRFTKRELLPAGALLGGAVLVRIGSLVALPAVGVYLFLTSKTPRELAKRLVLFFLPLLAALALICLYNYYRFGSSWQTGYGSETFSTPLLRGIYGLILSPGRGVFWYNPILFLSLFGFPLAYKTHKEETLTFLIFILGHLLFYSKWGAWEGGWVWGPRFLLAFLPYLALFMGAWIGKLKSKKGVILVSLLLLVSVAIQLSAVFASPERYYYQEHIKDPRHHMEKIEYNIHYSPLWAQWRSLVIVMKNINKGDFLYELAQEQKARGISEGEKGKFYFLTHNLAFNSPNLWLFYLWYSGAPKLLIVSVFVLLLLTIGFAGSRLLKEVQNGLSRRV